MNIPIAMGHQRSNVLAILFTVMLLMNGFAVDGKRTLTKNRSSSSSSSSSSSRRVSSGTHGSVTRPANSGYSHDELKKLTYGNHESSLNQRPASASAPKYVASAPPAQGAPPIGFKVPSSGNPQGPPPIYTQTNPIGGAHSNLHEKPPIYTPSNVAPPSYPAATNTGNTFGAGYGYNPAHPAPIQPTNMQSIHSYPKQEYYPGLHTPNHPQNIYYPHSNLAPMSGGIHPGGGIAYPPGATFIPVGSSLPTNAILVPQPQQSSSGPGFGTGLIAGAIGGGLLTHALSPGTSREVVHQSAPAPSNGERVIIINNGPPGSVTTSDVGGGTTVISNSAGSVPPALAPAPAPMGPNGPSIAAAPAVVPETAPMPIGPGIAAAGVAAVNVDASNSSNVQVPEPAANTPPPNNQYICIYTAVNVTSPTDPNQMVEVQQPVCYLAPSNGTETTASASGSLATATEPAKLEEPVQSSGVNAAMPTQKTSTALLPENSKIQQAAAGASTLSIVNFLTPTLFFVIIANCLH